MARILVVEDSADVARLIAAGLERQRHETTIASDGPEALDIAAEWMPDLVVLDVRLPTMDGFEVCRRLRTLPQTSERPILFLSAKAMLNDKLTGFRAGADDYLGKPFDVEELVWRVRALLRRAYPSHAECLQVGGLTLNCQTFEVEVDDETQLLTHVEFELLSFLMRRPGRVYSYDQLLQAVWGYPPAVGSPALVRVHIRNLREKIEPDPSRPVFLQTVRGHGYTIRAPSSQT
jgi:two-component system response regulator RpaA